MKPLPVSVRVNASLPAEMPAGEMFESEGTGFVIVSITSGTLKVTLSNTGDATWVVADAIAVAPIA